MYSDGDLPSSPNLAALQSAVGAADTKTIVVLKMNMKLASAKLASAFSEGVGERTSNKGAVDELNKLIVDGLPSSGAASGMSISFTCEGGAVSVSIDGKAVDGAAEGVVQPFLDMFLDKNTVSPPFQKECLAKCVPGRKSYKKAKPAPPKEVEEPTPAVEEAPAKVPAAMPAKVSTGKDALDVSPGGALKFPISESSTSTSKMTLTNTGNQPMAFKVSGCQFSPHRLTSLLFHARNCPVI